MIWDVHRRWKAPLSIFVVGRIVEREGDALKALISDQPGLWDVNSHGYSHIRIVRKIPWSRPQPSPRLIRHEIVRGAEAVRKILDRPCRGTSPAGGASAGFRGYPENLDAMRQAGCTWAMGYARSVFGETNPCDLYGPFTYADDGYPEITELPIHGWPDCTLKGAAGPALGEEESRHLQYIIKWPSPWYTPKGFVRTPEEEFQVHRQTIDVVARAQLPFCCLVFHPWCLVWKQDPEAKVIDLLVRYARDQGHEISSLDAEAARCNENPALLSAAPPVPETRDPAFDAGTVIA
jgi:peptidoglycan/xylan/chitin deacetylase (PgdA/CDA1 family)